MEAQLAEIQKHITKTYDKWSDFIKKVNDHEALKEHTLVIENAYHNVKQALTLVKAHPLQFKNEQLDLVEYIEKWRFLDRNIDRFIMEYRSGE